MNKQSKAKASEVLLAIDIGNTSISYGWFENGQLKRYCYGGIDKFPRIGVFNVRKGGNLHNYKVIISSVNPNSYVKVMSKLTELRHKDFKIKTYLIGHNIKPLIRHKYFNIKKLGKDRLVNIYGGVARWCKHPLLIINLGTATTCDFISQTGVFEGGLIIPGVETSWKALQERAALLPEIHQITFRKALLGQNTKDCMISGILQGSGAMVDGLVAKFRERHGKKMQVLISGGLAKLIKPFIKNKVTVDQAHTLKSLALIYQDYILQKKWGTVHER